MSASPAVIQPSLTLPSNAIRTNITVRPGSSTGLEAWPELPFDLPIPDTGPDPTTCVIRMSRFSPQIGTATQTRLLILLLEEQIDAFKIRPARSLPPRFVAAQNGVTLELLPIPAHPINNDLALKSMESIKNLVLECRESKGFWGLVKCAHFPLGAFKVELDKEDKADSRGTATS